VRDLKALRKDRSTVVRIEAVLSRAKLAKDPYTVLLELLYDSDKEVIKKGIGLLTQLNEPRVIPSIKALRSSWGTELRLYGAVACALIKKSQYQTSEIDRNRLAIDYEDSYCGDLDDISDDFFRAIHGSKILPSVTNNIESWEELLDGSIEVINFLGQDSAIALIASMVGFEHLCTAIWGHEGIDRFLTAVATPVGSDEWQNQQQYRLWKLNNPRVFFQLNSGEKYILQCRQPESGIVLQFVPLNVRDCAGALAYLKKEATRTY
jgi:hypothetical protein